MSRNWTPFSKLEICENFAKSRFSKLRQYRLRFNDSRTDAGYRACGWQNISINSYISSAITLFIYTGSPIGIAGLLGGPVLHYLFIHGAPSAWPVLQGTCLISYIIYLYREPHRHSRSSRGTCLISYIIYLYREPHRHSRSSKGTCLISYIIKKN